MSHVLYHLYGVIMKKAPPEQLILSEFQNLETELSKHLEVIHGLFQEVEAGKIQLCQEQLDSIVRDGSKPQQTLSQVKTDTEHLYSITAYKVIIGNKSEDQEIH